MYFDQTKGFQIFRNSCQNNRNLNNNNNNFSTCNMDSFYVALSALNALISYLQLAYNIYLKSSALKINLHFIDDIMVIDTQSILDLEIFLNNYDLTIQNSFVDLF